MSLIIILDKRGLKFKQDFCSKYSSSGFEPKCVKLIFPPCVLLLKGVMLNEQVRSKGV